MEAFATNFNLFNAKICGDCDKIRCSIVFLVCSVKIKKN